MKNKWIKIQAKFNFEYGATNVWTVPPNRGKERCKLNGKAVHNNQKPEKLIKRIIEASSDIGDVIWDVFGGTGSIALVANELGRNVYVAEIKEEYQNLIQKRIQMQKELIETKEIIAF